MLTAVDFGTLEHGEPARLGLDALHAQLLGPGERPHLGAQLDLPSRSDITRHWYRVVDQREPSGIARQIGDEGVDVGAAGGEGDGLRGAHLPTRATGAAEGARQQRARDLEQPVEVVIVIEVRLPFLRRLRIGDSHPARLGSTARCRDLGSLGRGGSLDLTGAVDPELLRPIRRRRRCAPGAAGGRSRRLVRGEQSQRSLTPIVERPSTRHDHRVGVALTQHPGIGGWSLLERRDPEHEIGGHHAVRDGTGLRTPGSTAQTRHARRIYCPGAPRTGSSAGREPPSLSRCRA